MGHFDCGAEAGKILRTILWRWTAITCNDTPRIEIFVFGYGYLISYFGDLK